MIVALAAAAVLSGPQLTRLSNGIPVIVHRRPDSPSVTLQALVRLDDLSPAELAEAEVVAGALFGETDSFSLQEFRMLAWSIGGNVIAEVSGDCLRVEVTTAKSHLLPAISFLTDALRRPTFNRGALEDGHRHRDRLHTFISQNPPFLSVRSLLASLSAGPAYVRQVSAGRAKALHQMYVRPERMAVAVVGDVAPESIATALSSLGGWTPDLPGRMTPAKGEKWGSADRFDSSIVAAKGPKAGAPDFPAWMTYCALVAQGKGSAISKEFRDKRGWSYIQGVVFSFRAAESIAAFYVSYSRARSYAADAKARTDELAAFLKSFPIDEGALTRAKAFLAGQYAVGRTESATRLGAFTHGHVAPNEQAFWSAWWEIKGAGMGMDARFPELVKAVTLDEVRNAAKKSAETFHPFTDIAKPR
ncbi:MAG: insulinase family protein [Armatimonadetes bacterium]|nr:insulinase family protein [Armatimonadota bacterium]